MKMKSVILALVVLFHLSCISIGDGVYKDFDEFSRQKVISCYVRLKQSRGFDTYQLVFTYNDINSSDEFSAYIYTETTLWYYFNQIGFKIDDAEPVYREETKFMRNILPNQKANEVVYFKISKDEIEKMAGAENVYFQIDGEKFKVNAEMKPQSFKTLQKFLEEVESIQ